MWQFHNKWTKYKGVPCFKKQKNSENFKTIETSINKISLEKH